MSDLTVNVFRIEKIEKHDNADSLSLIKVGGYTAIVRTDTFKEGDLAVYIPEQSIVPPDLLKKMGLEGKLAGKDGNRVKAVRLRQVLSQGLVFPANPEWIVGQDVTKELGITKYEPVVPQELSGRIFVVPSTHVVKFDIENWKNFPEVLELLENSQRKVVFSEKLHGTLSCFTLSPDNLGIMVDNVWHTFFASSKGQMGKNFSLIPGGNIYWLMAYKFDIEARMRRVFSSHLQEGKIVHILGESFGTGVQDLQYAGDKEFRIFDIVITDQNGNKTYVDFDQMKALSSDLGLNTVPILYEGPFSKELMLQYTEGHETISGYNRHIREGIVVKTTNEDNSYNYPDLSNTFGKSLGRFIFKSVSEKYLFRKNGTEYT